MSNDKIKLELLLKGCRAGNRLSQKTLYKHYYGYAMSIALRYCKQKEEAHEILNDGFLKIFNNLDKYDSTYPFKPWLSKVIVNAAIDYYKKHHKQTKILTLPLNEDIQVADSESNLVMINADDDMLPIIQALPPAYRMVFNLYVMEEYKHHEIAEALDISVGTSKSNLARAKEKLRILIKQFGKNIKIL